MDSTERIADEDKALLSLIIPTYNRLPQLQEAVESVLSQSLGGLTELIVVDDGSTDGTWEWLNTRFTDQPHNCVRLRSTSNSGPGAARNLALAVAKGRYFLPVDSDFLLIEGALKTVLDDISSATDQFHVTFFPCLEYPGLRKLSALSGSRTVTREDLLLGTCGELIPVVDIEFFREQKLSYPIFRAGGEGLLWAKLLVYGPGRFVDVPIVLYRTDVPGRICTLEFQLANADKMAEVSEALLAILPAKCTGCLRRLKARRLTACGTYHVLAGATATGRSRLAAALRLGDLSALLPLAFSLAGRHAFRAAFQFYRVRMRNAYLGAASSAQR